MIKYTIDGGLQNNDGSSIDVNSIYSKSYVDSINVQSDKTLWTTEYINEIFMFFYLRIKEYSSVFNKCDTKKFQVQDLGGDWFTCVEAARVANLKIDFKTLLVFHVSNVVLFLYSFMVVLGLSLLLPVWIVLTKKRINCSNLKAISIIRSIPTYEKMKFLEDSNQAKFYFDDILQMNSSDLSMYSHGSISQRNFLLVMLPYMAIRDYFLIFKDSKNLLGWQYTGFVLLYFCKRISHKCVFEYYLNLILKNNKQVVYYTGNKEDRFAIIEKRLCKKYEIKSICIPHGIEYAFRVPAGLVGDIFYCTTIFSQKYLSALYADEETFVYEDSIAKKMFFRGQPVSNITQIVFFPEWTDPGVNLLILKKLIELKLSILVKLHAKDSAENYKECSDHFSYITDFGVAISNKICLARKSTVLLEAIYNNSIPIAILTDSKDRAYVEYMLPSLNDTKIRRVYTFEELGRQLEVIKSDLSSRKMQRIV